jgi:hypothetical protein
MAYTNADLAQGEVKEFPHHYQMKHKITAHYRGEPFRFTLVTDGIEQEVEMLREGSHGARGDGSWYTELTVCPVATLDTLRGARIIHIDVDTSGRATYY